MLKMTDMLAPFAPASKPYQPMVGFEYEIQCFDKSTLSPVKYEGKNGWGEVLKTAARLTRGELSGATGEAPTKLKLPDQALISLEPGGQLEFSSSPKKSFQASMDQLTGYLQLLEELCQAHDLHLFFGGANPVHTPEQIGLISPAKRYAIMDAYFPDHGAMGRRMMRQTCSIQVTFDYGDREQGEDLLQTAQLIAPFAAAIFSNAPYLDGKRTPYRSCRAPIWAQTDPSRCGALPGCTEPSFGFERYVDFIVKAPMLFMNDGGQLVPGDGRTFEQFNQQGRGGREATLDDFILHNSSIFTDVRLKHTVEVRTVDSQAPTMLPAVVALLGGILHCQRSRMRVKHLLNDLTAEDYRGFPERLARDGIGAEVRGRPVKELAEALIDLAARGLPTCFSDGADALIYLDPIRELVSKGSTPADVVLEQHGDDAAGWLAAERTVSIPSTSRSIRSAG